MRIEIQILIALLLDLVLGDPRWLPHPVRLIGRLIAALEGPARRAIPDARLAGSVTALAVILVAALTTGAMIAIAGWIHPLLDDAVSILLLYTTLAARDLADHSIGVYRALERFDLAEARRLVSWLVGRDTERLTEAEVVRATLESIAENTVDGIIAPLFFAVIGGPAAAMAYKAASTLDSMIGYRNERYIDFGRTAAEIDDGANYIPARLAAPIIAAAAALTGGRAAAAWRIARRDGRKHMSPNAGIAEAAFAGALGIRLGGVMQRRLARGQIVSANRMMYAATGIAAAVFLSARWGITALLKMG
ncbi:MAG: adenosylcobinamide-phosphate synthase CbiB [Deltaproteobacteria bacterium]|nr:adenosylcobinamide-phosphate synthase CbiB [Deltaproteobacteria bacterium]